jgi:hypothetical protein
MSRLDKFIRRLDAQRRLLNAAIEETRQSYRPGDGLIAELGLGNGRTYHHLREGLPGFRVIAFERLLVAHPSSTPAPADLLLGEIEQRVPDFAAGEAQRAVLVHADLGNGIESDDRALERWLPSAIVMLSRSRTIVLSSTRLVHLRLTREPLAADVPDYEYFRYRVAGGTG